MQLSNSIAAPLDAPRSILRSKGARRSGGCGGPHASVDVVPDRLITGISRGYADLDWMALGLVAEEEAGLDAGR